MPRPPADAIAALAKLTGYPADTVETWWPDTETALDVDGMVHYLGISKQKVYDLLSSGEIPASKVGREWRISRVGLARWVDRKVVTPGTVTPDQLG